MVIINLSFTNIVNTITKDTVDMNKYPSKPNIELNPENIGTVLQWVSGFNNGTTPSFTTNYIQELETIYGTTLSPLFKKVLSTYNGYSPTRLIEKKYHPLNDILDLYSFAGFLSYANNCNENNINKYLVPQKFSKNDYKNCLNRTKLANNNVIPFGVAYDGSIWGMNTKHAYYIDIHENKVIEVPLITSFEDFMKYLRYSNRWWYK